MADIKIGSNTYEDVDVVRFPLSDGNGYAVFGQNNGNASIIEAIDMTQITYNHGKRLNDNSLYGWTAGNAYVTFDSVVTLGSSHTWKTLHVSCGEEYRMIVNVCDVNTNKGTTEFCKKYPTVYEEDISTLTNHKLSFTVFMHDKTEFTEESIQTMIGTLSVYLTTAESELVKDKPTTLAQANCLARASQMREIQYIPVADISSNGETSGTIYKGLDYSSVRDTDKFIGFNVSFETFLTAMNNPKSVIYTKTSEMGNGDLWYGVNCSAFVSYALGMPYFHVTKTIKSATDVVEVPLEEMQICDFIDVCVGDSGGHAILITGITRDKDGNIITIETSESGGYGGRSGAKIYLGYSAFVNEYINGEGYKVYRYNKMHKSPYIANDYIPLESEPTETIVYSDLCTNLGDKATILTNETITLNPLVTDGYTTIKLYKDGSEIGSYDVADVTLENLEAGKYTARLYPERENASTSFIVENANVYRAGTRYYFNGNGTPIRIIFKNDGYYTVHFVDLTEDDVARGYKDIEYDNSNIAYACVPFKNEYGFNVVQFNYVDEYIEYPYTLTSEDMKIGVLLSNGHVDTSTTNTYRLYTEKLWKLPTDADVSVTCTSDYEWICYFFDAEGNYIGKTSFTSYSAVNVLSETLSDGTIDGAVYFRISLKDASGNYIDLTDRIDEIMSAVTITIGGEPISEEPYTLTSADMVVGSITANGTDNRANSTTMNRIWNLEPIELADRTVSITCPSGYQWICYFHSGKEMTNDTFLGKTAFATLDIDDIKTATLASGTMEGATHIRISLRDSTATYGDLTGRVDEFMSAVTITVTP